MTTLVFGHKSPDTDSTVSPIIWAWYMSDHQKMPTTPVLWGEPNSEAAFVLQYWETTKPQILSDIPKGADVIVVDTNNPAELPPSIADANILGIIDHHMLIGGLKTKAPIDITIRPLACTATIMYDLIDPSIMANAPRAIKGLMLSCIISDTLEFRSPTTTEHDKKVAQTLAKDLGLDISTLANLMFEAKSDVSAFSDVELLRMDSKAYNIGGKELRVSVLETTAPQTILLRKTNLMNAMDIVAKEDNADQVLLFIVDILREESTMLISNELSKQIAENSFDCKVMGDHVVLAGVVSRKKQILPALKV